MEEGCNLIKDYLEFRMHQNETITEESKLIQTPSKFTSFTKIRKNLGNSVKRAFNRARFDQRPYVLRSYFSTILDNANIQHNRQKFYTGHKGDVQMTYTLRKQLSEDMIEEMREQFKELVEPRLSTEGSNEKEVVKGAFKKFATEIGLEVKEETPMEDTISEIAKVYKAAMEDLAKRSNNGKQKMIEEDKLDKYLEEGWELVNVLPSGKLVVKHAL